MFFACVFEFIGGNGRTYFVRMRSADDDRVVDRKGRAAADFGMDRATGCIGRVGLFGISEP